MNSFYKNKRKKGYSLAEVLVTVTILLILMAIAVPSVFTIRKNLRQKALDNKAELIYTAVQNNLVKLQNNGNSSVYAGDRATPMGRLPLDAAEEKTLYYATSSEKEDTMKAACALVTADTVDSDLYNNYWVVEYDPQSASVYAVFYSETRKDDYNTVLYNPLRYKEERINDGARVGYYGGDTVDGGNTSTLAPEITIKNEEKLVASISCMRPDSNPLSFEVTLQDTKGKKIVLKYEPDLTATSFKHKADEYLHLSDTSGLDANEKGSIVGKQYNLDITLDDLTWVTENETKTQPGRFNNLYGEGADILKNTNKQLTPGTPLTITVKVISGSSKINGRTATVKTNSLFEDSSTDSQANITYGRHLQNLDEASSGVTTVTSAVIKSDIHFEKQEGKEEIESWYSCYGKDMTFVPITNSKLASLQGKYESANGNVFSTIYHLTVEEQAKSGLFATLPDGITVDTLWMSGTRIKKDSSAADGSVISDSCAGAIAGEAGKATLTNCRVFLDASDVKGKDEKNLWITGAEVQGGLIGQTKDTIKIDKSFAATVMGNENANCVGGLIGEAKGSVKITDSYADSYLYGETVGGLIGRSSGSDTTILSSYTAGYLHGNKSIGGFLGETTQATGTFDINNGYTAVVWLGSADKVYAVSPSAVGNVYFLNAGTNDGETGGHGTQIGYDGLSNRSEVLKNLNSNSFTDSAQSSNPYNLKKQGLTSYSYPSLKGLPHYGDWEANFEPGSLVYYEEYVDDSLGFFGANVSSTLSDDKTVVGDGYGIVYSKEKAPTSPFKISYQIGADKDGEPIMGKTTIDPNSSAKYEVTVPEINKNLSTYVIYPLPADIVNTPAISETFYQKMIVSGAVAEGAAIETASENAEADNSDDSEEVTTGTVFYYNPHFAKAVVNGNTAPATPGDIYIRTARQLYNLSLYYTDYRQTTKKSKFVQELDINYAEYIWTVYANTKSAISVQNPIGMKGKSLSSFITTYEGRYHEIRGISFETGGTAVGFIGENAGTVQNVFLVSDYDVQASKNNPYVKFNGNIGNNKVVYMGVLAGINKGSIRNCAVCGYNLDGNQKVYVQRNGTLYLGGFTGSNKGTITNCEADSPSINANVLYGNAYMGGFAGENTGIIRNSYALGKVTVEYAKGAKAVIGGFTSQNTGSLYSDYCAVALTSSGTTQSYGFSPKGGKISFDCYYLNGGTFQYNQQMYAFDNLNGAGRSQSYKKMSEMSTKAIIARCHTATSTAENAQYPFVAVVKNSGGKPVHYGNWQSPVNLGAIGVVYWEREQGGSNDGYHFSYIGFKEASEDTTSILNKIKGSTLCTQHDDGGIITEYGYGYYYLTEDNGTDAPQWDENSCVNFQTGVINREASDALSERLYGFTVVAYTTAPSINTKADSTGDYMKMTAKDRTVNGTWKFSYKKNEYTFTINPFFANAMQYGSENVNAVASQSLTILENGAGAQEFQSGSMPGTEGNEYQIRSDDQLQYLNWNYNTGDAVTILDGDNYTTNVDTYPYLGYMYSGTRRENTVSVDGYYKWTGDQSPDLQKVEVSIPCVKCGGYKKKKDNSSYWEFVEDPTGEQYSVITKIEEIRFPSNWQYHYKVEREEKVGYWKWVGDGMSSNDNCEWIPAEEITEVTYEHNTSNEPTTIETADYNWCQTHDIDAHMSHNEDNKRIFTQIGSLYDENGDKVNEQSALAYMSYFSGSFDGNTYSIKNVEINSRNTVVGLFGSAVGAKIQNLILYSENGNYIQRSADSPRSWYALGGMCGLAAVGTAKNAEENTIITNCTVSGYTIQDNTTQSSCGDANVGGMFGMSTLRLENCSAVNKIVLNAVYDTAKDDGVSLRVGGLVGSMRGEVSNCYTGGEIYCTPACLENARRTGWVSWRGSKDSNGAKIFLGGITGGIYIKNQGTLLQLLGNNIKGIKGWRDGNGGPKRDQNDNKCDTPTTYIKNCYTYLKMPDSGLYNYQYIKSIQPIGNNAETPHESDLNFHVRIAIDNCYYYKNNIKPEEIKSYTTKDAGVNGGTVRNNIDNTAVAIDWDQLAGKKDIDNQYAGNTGKILTLLTDTGGKFSTVTVRENNQTVTGKYSFPGNRTDLQGEDYPFPTVLTQKSGGATVNVHYGEWPLEGISWKESRATMDIFEDMDLENDATKGQALKKFILQDSSKKVLIENTQFADFQFTYSNGDNDINTAAFSDLMAENAQIVFSDETDNSSIAPFSDSSNEAVAMAVTDTGTGSTNGNGSGVTRNEILDETELIAKVIDMQYDSNSGNYIATVKALKTGTTVITVTVTGKNNQVYSAAFTVTVTADLTVYADPASIKQAVGGTTDVTLYAVPTAMVSGTYEIGFASTDGDSEAVVFASDEDSAMNEAFSDDNEIFTADDTYMDMVSDTDDGIAVYAADIQNPDKNLASLMNWSIESDSPGALTWGEVDSNNTFFVISEAVGSATLTITGTYTYQNIEYRSTTWLDVNTTSVPEVQNDIIPYNAESDLTGDINGELDSADPEMVDSNENSYSSDLTSDTDSGYGFDGDNQYVDFIPNQHVNDFSHDEGNWESVNSGP